MAFAVHYVMQRPWLDNDSHPKKCNDGSRPKKEQTFAAGRKREEKKRFNIFLKFFCIVSQKHL